MSSTSRHSGVGFRGTLAHLSAVCFNKSAYAIFVVDSGEMVAVIIKDATMPGQPLLVEGVRYELFGTKVSIRGSLSSGDSDKFSEYAFNISCSSSSIRRSEQGETLLCSKPASMYGLGSESIHRGNLAAVGSAFFDMSGTVIEMYKHGWLLVKLKCPLSLSNSIADISRPHGTLKGLLHPHQCSRFIREQYCFVSMNYYTGCVSSHDSPWTYSCADIQVGDGVSIARALLVVLWGAIQGCALSVHSVVSFDAGALRSSTGDDTGNESRFKMIIPLPFYTGNHSYVVWWALTYEAAKQCIVAHHTHNPTSGLPQDPDRKTRKHLHAVMELIASLIVCGEGSDVDSGSAGVPAYFRVRKEHRSEICDFFLPHFASLFAIRSGLDADYLSQFLPQCYSPKEVIGLVSRYLSQPGGRNLDADARPRCTSVSLRELLRGQGDLVLPQGDSNDNSTDCPRFVLGTVLEVACVDRLPGHPHRCLLITLTDRQGCSILCVLQYDEADGPAVAATVAQLVSAPSPCFAVLREVLVAVEDKLPPPGSDSALKDANTGDRCLLAGLYLICSMRNVSVISGGEGNWLEAAGTSLHRQADAMWNRRYLIGSSGVKTGGMEDPPPLPAPTSPSVFAALSVRDVLMLPPTTDPTVVMPHILACVVDKIEQPAEKRWSYQQYRIVLSQAVPGGHGGLGGSCDPSGYADEISLYLRGGGHRSVGSPPSLLPDCISVGMLVVIRGSFLRTAGSKKFVYLTPASGFSINCVGFAPTSHWRGLHQHLAARPRNKSIYNQRTAVPTEPGDKGPTAPLCTIYSLVASRMHNRCIWTAIARVSKVRSISLMRRCQCCRGTQQDMSGPTTNSGNMRYSSANGASSVYPEFYRYANRVLDEPEPFAQATTRRYGLDLSIETAQQHSYYCTRCVAHTQGEICWECTAVVDDGSSEAHVVIDSKDAILLLLGIRREPAIDGAVDGVARAPRYEAALTDERYQYLVALLEQEAWQGGSVHYDACKAYSNSAAAAKVAADVCPSANKRQRMSDAPAHSEYGMGRAVQLLHSYILEYFADYHRESRDATPEVRPRKGCTKTFRFVMRIIVTNANSTAAPNRGLKLQRVNTHSPFSVDNVEYQTLCTHQLLLQAIFLSPLGTHCASTIASCGPTPASRDITDLAWGILANLNI